MILRLIVIILLAVCSGAGFAQVPTASGKPLSQASASIPTKQSGPTSLNDDEKDVAFCMIFAWDRSWFDLRLHLFSTVDLNQCDAKRIAPITNESARSQMQLLYPNAEFRVHGRYFQMADISVTRLSHSHVDVGKLKFSLIGEARFNLLDALKDLSVYLQLRRGNFTYIPFRTDGTVNLLWFEGSSVYELIAPDGTRYTMMSTSEALKTNKFGISLDTLGNFLNLPKGWRFERRTIDKIFRVAAADLGGQGQSCVTDELGNIYIHNDNSNF